MVVAMCRNRRCPLYKTAIGSGIPLLTREDEDTVDVTEDTTTQAVDEAQAVDEGESGEEPST